MPRFFPLDGKQVLITSPQDMIPIGLEFHAGNGTLCLIGSYEPNGADFIRERAQAVDYGRDFYAPQTPAYPPMGSALWWLGCRTGAPWGPSPSTAAGSGSMWPRMGNMIRAGREYLEA